MSILILSTSLNPDSKSRTLAMVAAKYAEVKHLEYEFVDLKDYPLPMCDGGESFGNKNVAVLSEKISVAKSILLAGPIYTYGIGAAAKNLIELTGKSWTEKPVGLMVAAGGANSYMSPLSLGNSLMLDYRCPIIPKYVYVDSSGFDDGDPVALIEQRIEELLVTTHHWGEVLQV